MKWDEDLAHRQLWYADDVRHAIRTETLERTKAAAILTVLEAQA